MYTMYRHVLKIQWSHIYTLTTLGNHIFSFLSIEQYVVCQRKTLTIFQHNYQTCS